MTPDSPWSLSPAHMRRAPFVARLVLPSPHGAAIAAAAPPHVRVVAACLRNITAVGSWLTGRGYGSTAHPVAVIAAGERWPDGSLRPAWRTCWAPAASSPTCTPRARDRCPPRQPPRERPTRAPPTSPARSPPVSGRELAARGFVQDVAIATEGDICAAVPVRDGDGAFSPAEPGGIRPDAGSGRLPCRLPLGAALRRLVVPCAVCGERASQVGVHGDERAVSAGDERSVGGDRGQFQAAARCGETARGLGDRQLPLGRPAAQSGEVDDDRTGAPGQRPANGTGEAVDGVRPQVSRDGTGCRGPARRCSATRWSCASTSLRGQPGDSRGRVIQMSLPWPSASLRTTAVPPRPRVSSMTVPDRRHRFG